MKLPPFRNLRALALENLTAPDLGDLALEVACILAGSPDLEELTMSLAKPVFSRPSAWAASQGSQPDPMDSRGLDWMDFFATVVDEFSRLLALESSEEQQPAKLRLRYLSVGHGIVLNPGGRFYGYSPPTILSLKLPDSGADWPADTGISADPTPLRTLSKLTSLARLERLHLRTNAPLVLGWAQLLPLYNEDALACISPATAPMLEELAVAAYSPTVAETLMRYSAFGRRGLVVRVDGSDGEVCGADEPWKDINGSTMGDLLLRRREVGGGSGGEGLRVAGMEGLMAWPRPSCVGRHENGLPDMNAVDESIRAVPYGGSNLTSDIDEERARVVSTLVRTWSSLRSLHVLIPKYWPRERRSHTSRVDTSYNLSLLEAVLMRPEMRGLLALRVTIESEDVPMAWAGNNITADVASRLAYASGRLRYVATNTLAWRIWRDETSFRLEELDASEQRVIRLLEETRTLGVRTRPAEDVEEYNWWPG